MRERAAIAPPPSARTFLSNLRSYDDTKWKYMLSRENLPPDLEHKHHDYTGNEIPWYVRAIWIGFWIFVVYYTIAYLFPAMQIELFKRP